MSARGHHLVFALICLGTVLLKFLGLVLGNPHRHPYIYLREYPNYPAMVVLAIVLSAAASLAFKAMPARRPVIAYAIAIVGSLANFQIFGSWEGFGGTWHLQLY
jgi:hypothetical protein